MAVAVIRNQDFQNFGSISGSPNVQKPPVDGARVMIAF